MNQEVTPETPAPEPTIDDVYKTHNIESLVSDFNRSLSNYVAPQPNSPQNPVSAVPDPVTESDSFKNFVAAQSGQLNNLVNELRSTTATLSQFQREKALSKLESDVASVVKTVQAKAGLENLENTVIEAMIDSEYRKSPKFKAIWDSRDRKPSALDDALGVISKKIAKTFSNQVDQNVAENRRAAREATRAQSATTAAHSDAQSRLLNMPDGEFAREWHRMKGY